MRRNTRNILWIVSFFMFGILLAVLFTWFGQQPTLDSIESNVIKVDQFGYRPQDPKVAAIVDSQGDINQPESFSPDETYQVVDAKTGRALFSAKIQSWKNGEIQNNSGDKGWWFDFSAVTQPGSYYLLDRKNQKRSYQFDIADDVYQKVLVAAVRTYFYQRLGVPKKPPYADLKWQDDAAFIGLNQDTEARYIFTNSDPKDMSGGWQDAGDTNKYVTFAHPVIHQLLTAYQENPNAFTDDFNIPESNNGIPDLIDELKFEIDWLKKMQDDDGGVFIKIGNKDFNDADKPSLDRRPRFYGPKCSSATIDAASMFAHTALIFSKFEPLQGYAKDLENRAVKAWQWYNINPKRTDCDNGEIKSGDADRSEELQQADSVVAAIYLFAITNEPKYSDYVRDNILITRPFNDNNWSAYEPEEGDALLFYSSLTNANAIVKQQILARLKSLANGEGDNFKFNPDRDLYRAYINDTVYHWGSNMSRANCANQNVDVLQYQIDPGNESAYQTQALGILNYFHGVNPLSMVYLSNMYQYGAENSVNEIYHEWFGDGSIYDNARTSPRGPAPGYLTGGPNASYTGMTIPPKDRPPQKAYRDFNSVEERSWEVSEPAIYYQSAYIKLLSKFVNNN